MSPIEEGIKEAEYLSHKSDDFLYETLGKRAQDVFNPGGYKRALQYSADFQHVATDMFGVDDLKEFGRRFWKNLQPQLMDLVCNTNNLDQKKLLQGRNVAEIAATLVSTGLIAAIGPPAWVVVVAALLARKIVDTGLDTMCGMWKKSSD